MGCSASKAALAPVIEEKSQRNRNERSDSPKSTDSGIELNESTPSESCPDKQPKSNLKSAKKVAKNKGIAFDVTFQEAKGIIKQHPPKSAASRLSSGSSRGRKKPNQLPALELTITQRTNVPNRLKRHADLKLDTDELQRRQEEAERKREMDRLAKIALQRRRELHAKKVAARRQRNQWDSESDSDGLDKDETYNNDDNEFNWDDEGDVADKDSATLDVVTESSLGRRNSFDSNKEALERKINSENTSELDKSESDFDYSEPDTGEKLRISKDSTLNDESSSPSIDQSDQTLNFDSELNWHSNDVKQNGSNQKLYSESVIEYSTTTSNKYYQKSVKTLNIDDNGVNE